MQKGFGGLVFILLIALVSVGIIGGAYFWSRVQFTKSAQPNIKACTQEAKLCPDGSSVGRVGPNCEFAACPQPAATPSNETTGWKTYTDNKSGYSINYPSAWMVEDSGRTDIDRVYIQSQDFVLGQPEIGGGFIPGAKNGIRLEIDIETNPNFKSYSDLKDFMETKFTGYPLNYFSNKTEITLNGSEAMLKTGGKPYTGNQDWVYTFHNGKIYELSLTSPTGQKDLFNQILTSMKFLQ